MAPSKFLKRFAEFVVGHPWPILVVLAVITAVAVFETRKIRFDFSPQSVIAGDAEGLKYAEEFKKRFAYEDALLFVVLEQTGDSDVLDRSSLEWQVNTANELKALPHVRGVQSVATLEVPQFSTGEQATVVPVVDHFPIDSAVEKRVRNLVDGSKMLEGTLISPNRTACALLVAIDPERRELELMRQDVTAVRKVLAASPPPVGYHFVLSGLPVLRTDIVDGLQAEQMTLLPLAALFFLVVLVFVFRRISGTLVPLLAVGVGLAWTIGIMAATGQSFSILSNMLPVLLMIIGVSNSVHIVCRYAEESKRFPNDRKRATIETIEQMAVACMLTYITTAIGFGSLATARSEILRDFGWQAAMGVVILYICLMLIMGTMLPFFRAPGTGAEADGQVSVVSRAMSAIANGVARHPVPSIASVVAVVIASFWCARGLVINSTMLETFEPTHPSVQSLRVVEDKLAGILPIEIGLRADDPDEFLKPDVYRKVAEFSQFARQQQSVLFARSYVDIQQDVYANFRNKPELFEQLPTNDDEGASRIRRTMLLINRAGESIHYNVFFSQSESEARVLLRVRDVGTRELLTLVDDLETKLGELFPEGSGIQYRLTGDAYLNAKSMDNFVRDLFVSLVTAAVTIFALIGVLFRSLRLGLLAAIPNTTPMAVTLGYMGLRGYDLNAGNVIVFTICLGIVVDDTIHFLTRYREEMARDNDVWKAIERSYHGTGRAIVLMTLLIVCGLSVLLLSNFVPTRRFAELTTLTMIAALFGDLLLLPASLVLFRGRERTAKSTKGAEPRAGGAAVNAPSEAMQVRRESD